MENQKEKTEKEPRETIDVWVHGLTAEQLEDMSRQFDQPIKELKSHNSVHLEIPYTKVTVYWSHNTR